MLHKHTSLVFKLFCLQLFLLLTIGIENVSCENCNNKLIVHFDSPKKHYLVGESIHIRKWVENHGDELCYYAPMKIFHFQVIDENGNHLPFRSGSCAVEYDSLPEFKYMKKEPLKPSETSEMRVRSVFSEFGVGPGTHGFFFEAGSYAITAKHAVSDTLHITVSWPKDSLQLRAAKRLTEIIMSGEMIGKLEIMYEFFNQFLLDYPNTVYTPRALIDILIATQLNRGLIPEAKRQEYAYRLVKEFPRSGFVSSGLFHLNEELLTKTQKQEVAKSLQETLLEFPNSFYSKRVEKFLEKIGN